MNDQRLPPHDRNAERAVLGCILRTPDALGDAQAIVEAANFYIFAHQLIYRAMVDLALDGGLIDTLTVSDLLRKRSQLDEVGVEYLASLWDDAPTISGVEHYAKIVRDYSVKRDGIQYGTDVAGKAYDPSVSAERLLEEAETDLYAIAKHRPKNETVALKQSVGESVDRLDLRSQRRTAVFGIPTGWRVLDDLTGGFQDGELVILGARPSVGKTAFVCNILAHLSRESIPWLFFSLEQARVEITDRLLCLQGKIDSHRVRTGWVNEQERQSFHATGHTIADKPGWINDRANLGMIQVVAEARRCQIRHGIRVVFIDYLQLVATEMRGNSRNDQVGEISRRLKILARELALPVVCLSQLNREIEKRSGGPRLSDLRDSGNIEQDADTVIFLHRPEETSNERRVIVAKQRNGPTGEVKMFFVKDFMEFGVAANEATGAPGVPQQWN